MENAHSGFNIRVIKLIMRNRLKTRVKLSRKREIGRETDFLKLASSDFEEEKRQRAQFVPWLPSGDCSRLNSKKVQVVILKKKGDLGAIGSGEISNFLKT